MPVDHGKSELGKLIKRLGTIHLTNPCLRENAKRERIQLVVMLVICAWKVLLRYEQVPKVVT